MPNPQPVVRLTGVVMLARQVTPEPFTNSRGQARTPDAYGEVTVQTEVSSFEDEVVDLPSYQSMRTSLAQVGKFQKGDWVDVYVRSYAGVVVYGSKFSDQVVFRYAGEVPPDVDSPPAVLAASPPSYNPS